MYPRVSEVNNGGNVELNVTYIELLLNVVDQHDGENSECVASTSNSKTLTSTCNSKKGDNADVHHCEVDSEIDPFTNWFEDINNSLLPNRKISLR